MRLNVAYVKLHRLGVQLSALKEHPKYVLNPQSEENQQIPEESQKIPEESQQIHEGEEPKTST